MTLRAYQTLYESSVAFGMRKALMAEQGKSELERKVGDEKDESLRLSRRFFF
jgi:dynein light intermediate chain